MAVRVFSDEDLERLRSFPKINPEELIRFFTLTPALSSSSIPAEAEVPVTAWAWPCSSVRCRGWDLSQTLSPWLRPLLSPVCLNAYRSR
jgi:hypothetical protein